MSDMAPAMAGRRLPDNLFLTRRRGVMGEVELGADYMPDVDRRAKRLREVLRESARPVDARQLLLPGCPERG